MAETKPTLTPSGAAISFPEGRYGRRREPSRRPAWLRKGLVAVAVLGVVLASVAIALALGRQYAPGGPYRASVERFYDITDDQVVVEFTVAVPEGESAICAVRARAAHGGEVGRDEIVVDPPPGVTRPRVTHRLTTSERPVTGEVQRCWQQR